MYEFHIYTRKLSLTFWKLHTFCKFVRLGTWHICQPGLEIILSHLPDYREYRYVPPCVPGNYVLSSNLCILLCLDYLVWRISLEGWKGHKPERSITRTRKQGQPNVTNDKKAKILHIGLDHHANVSCAWSPDLHCLILGSPCHLKAMYSHKSVLLLYGGLSGGFRNNLLGLLSTKSLMSCGSLLKTTPQYSHLKCRLTLQRGKPPRAWNVPHFCM